MSDKTYDDLRKKFKNLNGFDEIGLNANFDKPSPISSADFTKLDIPQKPTLMHPWLKEGHLAFLYAAPGVGKTFFALSVAYALASGQDFLKFTVHKQCKVLYIEGEMDASALFERWRMMNNGDPDVSVDFIYSDMFESKNVHLLSDIAGRKYYEDQILLNKYDVVILDNVSCLTDIDENKASEWNPIMRWITKLQNLGVAIILIHHTNKTGKSYSGSGRVNRSPDTGILLMSNTDDDEVTNGASFTIKFDKHRGFFGEDAKKFDVKLNSNGAWEYDDTNYDARSKVIARYKSGESRKEITDDLAGRHHRSTIWRWISDAAIAGLIDLHPDDLKNLRKRKI